MVESFLTAPGATEKNVDGERMTWSSDTPSSRCWIRSRCTPEVAKYTGGPSAPTPYALSCHPQFEITVAEPSSRLTTSASVEPIRWTGAPADVTAPENCTKNESFV